jgi:ribosomal protein S18 acetylase RimI-like enzyme
MSDSRVIRCPAHLRSAALRGLHAARSASQSESLAAAVDATADEAAWDGLLIMESPAPEAAVWVQPSPGNTASVWPPPPEHADADELLRAAARFVDERRIILAQMNVAADVPFTRRRMAEVGFPHLADLLYLFAETAAPVRSLQLPANLAFVQSTAEQRAHLAQVVARTYEGTLDCPALDGVRSIVDVLSGYQQQGEYLADQWYIVRVDGVDAGVLILANHAATGNWELVYMGVTPEARGHGLGSCIVSFARNAAARGGAQRIVLAVDAANQPAVDMYGRAGFLEWERRAVYARMASRTSEIQ